MVTPKLTADEAQAVLDLVNERMTEVRNRAEARCLTRSWSGHYEPDEAQTAMLDEVDRLALIRSKLTA